MDTLIGIIAAFAGAYLITALLAWSLDLHPTPWQFWRPDVD